MLSPFLHICTTTPKYWYYMILFYTIFIYYRMFQICITISFHKLYMLSPFCTHLYSNSEILVVHDTLLHNFHILHSNTIILYYNSNPYKNVFNQVATRGDIN
jgi:hypothetical protein